MRKPGNINKPKRYRLDCQHELWLSVPPQKHDQLWCSRCGRYEHLLGYGSEGISYDPSGEFRSERVGKFLLGFCLHKDCKSVLEPIARTRSANYAILQKKMHSHYMRSHTRWITTVEMKKAERLPPNSPPPF